MFHGEPATTLFEHMSTPSSPYSPYKYYRVNLRSKAKFQHTFGLSNCRVLNKNGQGWCELMVADLDDGFYVHVIYTLAVGECTRPPQSVTTSRGSSAYLPNILVNTSEV
ncbi:hypothetical protein J6590_029885 [Homalodisca vitripennis]|nr:hypothetical protein J6590_029885 [Homalodisca vitripennis]